MNNFLFAETVSVNNFLFVETVFVNNIFLKLIKGKVFLNCHFAFDSVFACLSLDIALNNMLEFHFTNSSNKQTFSDTNQPIEN